MTERKQDRLEEAMSRVVELEAELESAANPAASGSEIERLHALLHDWVDSVVAVVSAPGSGRVVLLHQDGSESRISSPQLPYKLAAPVSFAPRKG